MASIGASGIPITESSKLNFTPHILITLPERAIDFIEKRVAIVDQCKFLVLNETGKLSVEALNRLAGHLPQQRQTLLFFETFNIEISEFAVKHLNNAFEFELMQVCNLFGEYLFLFILRVNQKLNGVQLLSICIVIETSDRWSVIKDTLMTK